MKLSQAERDILHRAAANDYVPAEDILSAVFPDAKVTREGETVVFDLTNWMSGEKT